MRKFGLKIALVFWSVLIAVAGAQASSATRSYDVVIAGAGTGGTAAALTAARLGAHVALLEETDWIGGQAAAAAVSTMDEGNNLTPPSGIYREFVARMQAYYAARGLSVGTCYWASNTHCYEPSAIRKILQQMIGEVNHGDYGKGRIDLILEDHVVRVLTSGDAVIGAVTAKGLTLSSKILIDATEYGDVLPLTPADYRSGRSMGNDQGKSCTQDLTYTLVIRKYPHGVPDKLVMKHEPPEYQKWLPRLRAQWRIDGNPSSQILPVDFGNHNAYRGLPDSSNPEPYTANQHESITRTVLNWFNDYPTQTNIFDRAERKKILCEAKLKTLANLYYLQHNLQQGNWSVADDEGYDTAYNRTENSCPNIPAEFKEIEAHFPAAPYIRESQRLVGEYTLTGGDVRRERQGGISVVGFADSIAVGDYADDLHACDAASDLEFDLEHLSDRAPGFRSGPFEVPLRALIPKKVDGLLVAEKNISESRLANGATRLQPITMLTGQAAGTLAALAVRENKQPRAVSAVEVQGELLKMGSILAREPMADLDQGMMPWKAAQFVVAHQWMTMGEKGFQPEVTLTRGDVAAILDRVFQLSAPADNINAMYAKANFERSSFADVLLYSPIFSAVENWRKQAAIPACTSAPALFCPDGKIRTGEFVDAVLALGVKKNPALTRDALRRNVSLAEDAPLSRIQAAIILFNSAQ
jgi:hypothetical protein